MSGLLNKAKEAMSHSGSSSTGAQQPAHGSGAAGNEDYVDKVNRYQVQESLMLTMQSRVSTQPRRGLVPMSRERIMRRLRMLDEVRDLLYQC